MLSWFDESPTMLASCVASLSNLRVSHLVAVDGAYALMPGARGCSGIDQTRAITDVAASIGVGLTLHVPRGPWRGNEIEKRNASLQLALATSTEDDWLLVIDADEVVTPARGDCHRMLSETELDVATYGLTNTIDPLRSEQDEFIAKRCAGGLESVSPVPGLLRALPSLRYESNHYTVTDGNRVLCPLSPISEDALDLTGIVRVEHRKHLRDEFRAARAATFYAVREATQIERVHPEGVPA